VARAPPSDCKWAATGRSDGGPTVCARKGEADVLPKSRTSFRKPGPLGGWWPTWGCRSTSA